MRKFRLFAALMGCFLLAGCGPQTPLAHALTAFRAGDVVDFLKAQAEANEAVKTAIQPGGDLCRVSGADIAKYHAVHVIEDLNRPALFQRSEEERLAYALSVAGKEAHIWPGSFLEEAPIVKMVNNAERDTVCGTHGEALTAMAEGGPYMQADNEARMNVFQAWIGALKKKHGDRFDAQMEGIAQRMTYEGYQVAWPPDVDFGDYAQIETFEQMRAKLK